MACQTFGVEFMLTGAPGIRRKYQQEALPQLVVRAAQKGLRPVHARKGDGSTKLNVSKDLPTTEGPFAGHSSPSPAYRDTGRGGNSTKSTNGCAQSGCAPSTEASDSGSNSCSSSDSCNNSKGCSNSDEKKVEEGAEEPLEETGETEESRRRFWRLEDVREDTDIMERPKLTNDG